MDPIAHTCSGILLGQGLRPLTAVRKTTLLVAGLAALSPDVDSVSYLWRTDAFYRVHHTYTRIRLWGLSWWRWCWPRSNAAGSRAHASLPIRLSGIDCPGKGQAFGKGADPLGSPTRTHLSPGVWLSEYISLVDTILLSLCDRWGWRYIVAHPR